MGTGGGRHDRLRISFDRARERDHADPDKSGMWAHSDSFIAHRSRDLAETGLDHQVDVAPIGIIVR